MAAPSGLSLGLPQGVPVNAKGLRTTPQRSLRALKHRVLNRADGLVCSHCATSPDRFTVGDRAKGSELLSPFTYDLLCGCTVELTVVKAELFEELVSGGFVRMRQNVCFQTECFFSTSIHILRL